jgi:hypothetical protein
MAPRLVQTCRADGAVSTRCSVPGRFAQPAVQSIAVPRAGLAEKMECVIEVPKPKIPRAEPLHLPSLSLR